MLALSLSVLSIYLSSAGGGGGRGDELTTVKVGGAGANEATETGHRQRVSPARRLLRPLLDAEVADTRGPRRAAPCAGVSTVQPFEMRNEFLGRPVLPPVWVPEEVRVSLLDHPPLDMSTVTWSGRGGGMIGTYRC